MDALNSRHQHRNDGGNRCCERKNVRDHERTFGTRMAPARGVIMSMRSSE